MNGGIILKLNYQKISIQIILFIYPFFPLIKEWSLFIGNIMEVLFFIVLIILSTRYHNRNFYVYPQVILMFAFILLYLTFSKVDFYSKFSILRIFMLYPLFFYSLKNLLQKNYIKKEDIIKPIVLCFMVMVAGAIIQMVFPNIIKNIHLLENYIELRSKTDFVSFSIYNRAISFMLDPNLLGTFFSLILVIINQSSINIESKKIVNILCVFGIILTQSRTAFVLAGIYILYISFKKLFLKKKINKYLFIVIILLSLFGTVYLYINFDNILIFLRIDTFLGGNGRFDKNLFNITELVKQNVFFLLFGNGYNNQTIFENTYIFLLNTFGIVGTGFFFLINFYMIKQYINNKSLIVIIIYLIANFVGDYYLIPQISYLVFSSFFLCNIPNQN